MLFFFFKDILTVVAVGCIIGLTTGQATNICADVPNQGTIAIGNPLDCTRFTRCIGTTPIEIICPPNMHFSATEGQCDIIENARCVVQGPPPPPPGGGNRPVCSIDINYEVIASRDACNQFTVCACGHPHFETCANTLIFDARTQRCDLPNVARCVSDVRNNPTCTDVGNVAHPNDCRHFYLCLGAGTAPTLNICAPGLNFNPANRQCDIVPCTLAQQPPNQLPRFARYSGDSCKV